MIPSSKASLHDAEFPNQHQAFTLPISTTYHQMLQYFLNPPQSFHIPPPNNQCLFSMPPTLTMFTFFLKEKVNLLFTFLPCEQLPHSHHQTGQTLLWPLCPVVFPCTQVLAFVAIWEAGKLQNRQGRKNREKQRAERWGRDADKEVREEKGRDIRKREEGRNGNKQGILPGYKLSRIKLRATSLGFSHAL